MVGRIILKCILRKSCGGCGLVRLETKKAMDKIMVVCYFKLCVCRWETGRESKESGH
jgi:hypothetical protein